MWKKRPQGEQLEDPKKAKQAQRSEMKMKSDDLDNELANLHGAQAFIEFMNTKSNTRRPEFLNSISTIQEQRRKEEEARRAAEEAKKARLQRRAVKEEKPEEIKDRN